MPGGELTHGASSEKSRVSQGLDQDKAGFLSGLLLLFIYLLFMYFSMEGVN